MIIRGRPGDPRGRWRHLLDLKAKRSELEWIWSSIWRGLPVGGIRGHFLESDPLQLAPLRPEVEQVSDAGGLCGRLGGPC